MVLRECLLLTVAASRGHHVTLFEASNEVGGQFNLAKVVPGKEEFHETIRYFKVQIEKTGVDLRLNTKVNREQLEREGFDEVVIATGVVPRALKIEGSECTASIVLCRSITWCTCWTKSCCDWCRRYWF